MDPLRDETPSRRALLRRRPAIPKSYVQSSPNDSQPTLKEKKAKKPAKGPKRKKTEKLYPTKDQAILAERTEDGEVKYLVNWANDTNTGEVYAPTWEPGHFVVEGGRLQWEQQKREGKTVVRGDEIVLKDPDHTDTESGSRPAKRRRESNTDQSPSQENSPAKRTRLSETPNSDEFESTLSQSSEPKGQELEVKDTYEEDTNEGLPENLRVQVELSVPVGFDRSIYTTAFVNFTQASVTSSPQDSRPQESGEDSSQLVTEAPRPLRRQSPFLIPDSQDKAASDSYDPSTQSRPNTGSGTESHAESGPDFFSIGFESSRPVTSSIPESIDTEAEGSLSNLVDFTYQNPAASTAPESSATELQSLSNPVRSPRDQTPVQEELVVTPSTPKGSLKNLDDLVFPEESSQLLTPTLEARDSTQKQLETFSSPLKPTQSPLRESQSNSNSFPSNSQLPSPGDNAEAIGIPYSNGSLSASIQQPPASPRVHSEPESQTADHSGENHQPAEPKSQEEVARTQHSESENTWTAINLASSAPQDLSITPERPPIFPVVNQIESFVQFSAPSQIDSTAPHSPGTHFSIESPTAAAAIQHTPEPLERVFQSIEEFEELAHFSPASVTPEPPFRQVVGTYNHSTSSASSSPAMEDLAAAKAARRAARKKALEQKFRDNYNRGEAAYRAASSISLSPLSKSSQQPEPPQYAREDDITPLQDIAQDPISEGLEVIADAGEAALVDQHHVHPPAEDADVLSEPLQPTNFQVVPDSNGQYYLPLPLNAITRDIYFGAVKSSSTQRFDFVSEEVLDPGLTTKIDDVLENLDLLCSHSDLITDEYPTQQMVAIEARARFAENRSTKCIFIAELIDAMRGLNKDIAILVRPGRMLEILDAVLRYHKFDRHFHPFKYTLPDNGSLRVWLIPTEPCSYRFRPVDLVVAFDSTFTEEPYVEQLRRNAETLAWSPLVHLVINQSIEHIEKNFPKDMQPMERKIKIVNCISDILGEVGKLSREYLEPDKAARAIATFVAGGAHSENWPCLPMPVLVEDGSTQGGSEGPRETGSRTASQASPTPALVPQQASKRPLEDDNAPMGTESPKRQRLSPVTGGQENESSAAQLSPLQQSSGDLNGSPVTSSLEKSLRESEAALLKEVADLKAQLRKKEASETEVRRLNGTFQSRIADLTLSIGTILLPKYQEALNDLSAANHTARDATTRSSKLMTSLESRTEEIAKLKAQKEALNTELTEARATLAASSAPGVAQFEALRAEIRLLNTEKERLEKQRLNLDKDIEYLRSNYQTASASAAESANSIIAMTSEIEMLHTKASENAVRIHEIQRDNETAAYVRMVKQLKLEKAEMARELEKKTNELAVAMNGRRSARGASQPKSPRLASPSNGSLAAQRNLNRVIQRSRGTSPANVGPEFAVPGASRPFAPIGFGEPLPNGQSYGGQESRFREYRP